MQYYSPLRYPGGKASFKSFLDDVILLNDLQEGKYYEPYAGGAGAALGLLMSGRVSELFLNDADIRVFAFWRSLLDYPVYRFHTIGATEYCRVAQTTENQPTSR